MNAHKTSLSYTALILLAAAAPSRAAVLLDESFNYATGSSTTLNGGTGFGGAYTGTGTITTPGLTHPGITSAGNTFTTVGNNTGSFRLLAAPLGTNSGTVFVRFLTAATAVSAPNYYAGLSFFTGGSEELFFGDTGGSAAYGFDVSGVTAVSSTTAVSTATTLLVYRLSFGAVTDTIDMFVNPGSTLPAIPTATFTTADNGVFPATFDNIRLQSGGTSDSFRFDEIRIATTAAEVLPVPEPGSAVLLVGGLALLGTFRRRK